MGIKERREREKQLLRQKILDAAQHIIHREGFAALSMRKLANRVEYSAASIYLHFRNREHIAQELSEVGYGKLFVRMQAAANHIDPAARLRAAALAYVEFGIEHPETYRLMFMADSEYTSVVFGNRSEPANNESAANRSFQLLVDIGNDLKRKKLYTGNATSTEIAEMIWASAHGIVSLHLTCPVLQTSAAELTMKLIDALISGLLLEKNTPPRTSLRKTAKAPANALRRR